MSLASREVLCEEVYFKCTERTPVPEPDFDFTAKGNFSPFTDYPYIL